MGCAVGPGVSLSGDVVVAVLTFNVVSYNVSAVCLKAACGVLLRDDVRRVT